MTPEDKAGPLACTLAPGELAQRREETIQALFKRVCGTRELAEGFEFTFPGEDDLVSDLLDFIKFERNCCRFLRFELTFEPEEGPLHLRILGTSEAKPVIREMFMT